MLACLMSIPVKRDLPFLLQLSKMLKFSFVLQLASFFVRLFTLVVDVISVIAALHQLVFTKHHKTITV